MRAGRHRHAWRCTSRGSVRGAPFTNATSPSPAPIVNDRGELALAGERNTRHRRPVRAAVARVDVRASCRARIATSTGSTESEVDAPPHGSPGDRPAGQRGRFHGSRESTRRDRRRARHAASRMYSGLLGPAPGPPTFARRQRPRLVGADHRRRSQRLDGAAAAGRARGGVPSGAGRPRARSWRRPAAPPGTAATASAMAVSSISRQAAPCSAPRRADERGDAERQPDQAAPQRVEPPFERRVLLVHRAGQSADPADLGGVARVA